MMCLRSGLVARGITFASYHYDLGSNPGCCSLGLTLCHMWDVFHLSQPISGGDQCSMGTDPSCLGLGPVETFPNIIIIPNSIFLGIRISLGIGVGQCK